MLLRKKLKPKELKEFDMYFGNLRALAKKDISQEGMEELKLEAMYSKRIYRVVPDDSMQQKATKEFWEEILQIFYSEMNETQREIREEYNLLTKMAIAVLGETIYLEKEERTIAKVHSIDIILNAFSNKTFIENVFQEVKQELYVPKIRMTDLYGHDVFEMSLKSDFSRIILPDMLLNKIRSVSTEYAQKITERIIYYILIVLDILDSGLRSASLIWVILSNYSLKEVLFNNILTKLPEERVAFWQVATLARKYLLYDFELFSSEKIQYIEQCILGIKTNCSSNLLVSENYYFNIAQAIIFHDENMLAVYFSLNKEERNIVINESVIMARKIESILLKELESFDIESVYENPKESIRILNDIGGFFQIFYFTRQIMIKEMEKRKVNKADWKFLESIFLLRINETNFEATKSSLERSIRKLEEVARDTIYKWELNQLKELSSKIKSANTMGEALGIITDSFVIDNNNTVKLEVLEDIKESTMQDFIERIRSEMLNYSIENLSSKNADLNKATRLLEAIDNEYISIEEFCEAQRKMGVKEKYIKIFCIFYLPENV